MNFTKMIMIIITVLISWILIVGGEPVRVKRHGVPNGRSAAESYRETQGLIVQKAVNLTKETLVELKFVGGMVEVIEKDAEAVVEAIVHPVNFLLQSYTGTAILILAFLAFVLVIVKAAAPGVGIVWTMIVWLVGALYTVVRFISHHLWNSSCCVSICALKPFVAVRNRYVARKLKAKEMELMQIYTPGEEVDILKKTYSALHTDETGVYLLASDNHRVYLNAATSTEDVLMMQAVSASNRDKGSSIQSSVKEAMIHSSKLYKVDKLPDFQGQFVVDDLTIGHFSRIKFKNKDCIITAFHVLDYNRSALVSLRKGDKAVRLDSVKTRIVAASRTDELDFLIMELPSFVFSALGLRVGVWTPRVQSREPVSIYQLYEGKPCVSNASIRMSTSKPWHVEYSASTLTGASGAPILDSRNRIVGVHLEHDVDLKCNVGVIPPLFRNERKESPTNEDIAQTQPEMEVWAQKFMTLDEIRELNLEAEHERLENQYLEEYMVYVNTQDELLSLVEKASNWADAIDIVDNFKEEQAKSQGYKAYRLARSNVGTTGRHINQRVKGGIYRKESPWSCSKCFTIHEKGHNCKKCGYCLVPLTKKRLESMSAGVVTAKEEVLEKVLPAEIVDKISNEADRANLVGEVALKVIELLKGRAWENPVTDDQLPSYYPSVVVPVEKKLLQSVATRQSQFYPDLAVVNGQATLETRQMDPVRSEAEGSVVLTKVATPVCTVTSVKPDSKSKAKEKKQKETLVAAPSEAVCVVTEESKVPLNFQAPAAKQTGESVIPGLMGASNLVLTPQLLATAQLLSLVQGLSASLPSGNEQKSSIPLSATTLGPQEVRKRRKRASKSSAKST